MQPYPSSLILAVATGAATIFLGFLPTRHLRAAVLSRECALAGLAWFLVAWGDVPGLAHIHLGMGLLCLCAWWQLRRDRALAGKVWLSVASGLGISVGVTVLLASHPQVYPPGLPPSYRTLELASIYLGGGLIGLGYVCFVLAKALPAHADLEQSSVRRYAGLLLGLALLHAAVELYRIDLLATVSLPLGAGIHNLPRGEDAALGISVLALPGIAFAVYRAVSGRRLASAISALLLFMALAVAAESLTRLVAM